MAGNAAQRQHDFRVDGLCLDEIPKILQGPLTIAAKISAPREGNVAPSQAGALRLKGDKNPLIREPGTTYRKWGNTIGAAGHRNA
jgi:hypothetical protein